LGKLNLKELELKWFSTSLSGMHVRAGFLDYDKKFLKKKNSRDTMRADKTKKGNRNSASVHMGGEGVLGSTSWESMCKDKLSENLSER
jgi:hypothetical protein